MKVKNQKNRLTRSEPNGTYLRAYNSKSCHSRTLLAGIQSFKSLDSGLKDCRNDGVGPERS